MKYDQEYANKMKADLYYDLLDKYVALKQKHSETLSLLKQRTVELSSHKENITPDGVNKYNQGIQECIRTLYRRRDNPGLLHLNTKDEINFIIDIFKELKIK